MADARTGSNLIRLLVSAAAASFFVWIDQFTKNLAVAHLKNSSPVPLIDGVLELTYVENNGAAFGILKGSLVFFCIISTVVILAILYLIWHLPFGRRHLPLNIVFVFILSGAAGNMIDRVRTGYVVDFIYFKLIDFPVFNVADIYITCSFFVLLILIAFVYKEDDLILLH